MVHRFLGDFETAKRYLEQSLVLYQQCKPANDIKIAWVLQQLGIVYKEVGDFETAKKFTEDSLTKELSIKTIAITKKPKISLFHQNV